MYFANRVRYFRACDAVTNAPTGDRIRFRHRIDDHRAIAHPLNLGHRDVLDLCPFTRVKNVFVDLVGETKGVELSTEFADEFHFVASEHFAGRVIGIADDDCPGLWIERRAQLRRVESPIRRAQRHITWARVGKDGIGRIVLVERLEDYYLFARIDSRHHRGDHSFGRAARDRDFSFRIDLKSEIPFRFPRNGFAKILRSPGNRILIHVVGNRLHRDALDVFGSREVRKTLREIDRAVLHRLAGHLANDGFSE